MEMDTDSVSEEQQQKLEQQKIQEHILQQEQLQQEQLHQERLLKEKLQQEQLQKEQLEKEKLQQEQLEKERLHQEQLQQERLHQEKLQQQKLQQERLEQERLREEQLKLEKLEKEKLRKEQQQREELQKELLKKEQMQKELLQKEQQQEEPMQEEPLHQVPLKQEQLPDNADQGNLTRELSVEIGPEQRVHLEPHFDSKVEAPHSGPVLTPKEERGLVSEVEPGKHSLPEDAPPVETKRARRERKRSNIHANQQEGSRSTCAPCDQPAKLSPYDIFEFRDSDEDELDTKKGSDTSNQQIVNNNEPTEETTNSTNTTSPKNPTQNIPCRLSTPPVSTNLLQTATSVPCAPPPPFVSPMMSLNSIQSAESAPKASPRLSASPAHSSNENRDPAQVTLPRPKISPAIAPSSADTISITASDIKPNVEHIRTAHTLETANTEVNIVDDQENPDTGEQQKGREYVTELNQDGKLSLTIRKASNQSRDTNMEFKSVVRVPTDLSFNPSDSHDSGSMSQNSMHNLATCDQQSVDQSKSSHSSTSSTSTATVKPTRRSARLMQTKEKRDPSSSDEQAPPRESVLVKDPTMPPTKLQNITQIVLKDKVSQEVDPSPVVSGDLKENTLRPVEGPSVKGVTPTPQPVEQQQQVGGEPTVKTRRYTRGKKVSVKQQQQQQQPQPQPQAQPANANYQTSSSAMPTVQQQAQAPSQPQDPKPKIPAPHVENHQPQPSAPIQTPASETPRRPKRLTRLAAKTYGGNIPPPTEHQPEPPKPTQPALEQSSATNVPPLGPVNAAPISAAPVQQPVAPVNPIAQPIAQAPAQPQQHPTTTAPLVQIPVPASVIHPTPTPHPQPMLNPSRASSAKENVETVNTTDNVINEDPTTVPQMAPAPARISTPMNNVDPVVQSDVNKVTPFCMPSYLPPRKRLGWFWSQKQLLEQRYLVVWTSRFTLKDSFAAVQMHFISGNNKMPSWSYRAMLDETGMPLPIHINQRMRLDPDQLEGVQSKMSNDEDHCVLLAVPVGRDQSEYLKQSTSLKVGFIDYLMSKQAAGIVHVCQPGESQASYIIHIFPSCTFVDDHILRREPDLLNVTQNIDNLIVVITTA